MNDNTYKLDRPLFFAGAWRPLDKSTGTWYLDNDGQRERWVKTADLDRWLEEEENR